MSKISILGLGAMGSRMASNLLKAGHSVTVWNRTSGASDALAAAGATKAATPKEAVIHFVGPLGSGALVKLATNALLGVQVTALAELIGLLKNAGTDVAAALKAISSTAAWSPAANPITSSMLGGNFAPQFPIELIEKDFGYAIETAGSPSAAPTIAAARGVFQRALESGLGGQNMTGVVLQFTEQPS